jgi:hypothetical protein
MSRRQIQTQRPSACERNSDDGQHLSHDLAAGSNRQRGSMILERAEVSETRRKQHLGRFAHQPSLCDALLHDVDGAQQRIRDRGQRPHFRRRRRVSTVSTSIRQFEVGHPGVYRLLVTGIVPTSDLARVELILARPYAGALFLLIVATVFGGASLIGGLVFTALQYVGKL